MRPRAEGRWQFRVYEGRDPITGKATYRTRSFEGTKRQAESALAAFVVEVDAPQVSQEAIRRLREARPGVAIQISGRP